MDLTRPDPVSMASLNLRGEDFAASADKVGLTYETVLQRIINLGLRWQPESVA